MIYDVDVFDAIMMYWILIECFDALTVSVYQYLNIIIREVMSF